jgi:hypothetical protein
MSKEEMTEVLEAIEEVAKHIGRFDPPMQPNYLVLSLGNQVDTLRRLISEQEQSSIPEDPMDTPLPCDVTVGHVTIRKGVALRTLVARMQVLYDMAQATQSQGEPVAYLDLVKLSVGGMAYATSFQVNEKQSALYTEPQKQKPMTDYEFTTAIEVAGIPVEDVELVWAIKDLVEAHHDIKAVA